MSLRAQMSYIVTVLNYLMYLRACVLLWHSLFHFFFYIWKVEFQKSLYSQFFFYWEMCLELSWTSMMELFAKIFISVLPLTNFCKKYPSKMFDWVLNTPLTRIGNMLLTWRLHKFLSIKIFCCQKKRPP